MQAGLGLLALPPEPFWAMTLRELTCALDGAGALPPAPGARARGIMAHPAAPSPLARRDLLSLMESFPDR